MTDTSHRLYAVVIAVVVFFVSWATVAAKPWATAKPDPRLAALAQREQRLRADAKLVQQVVDSRMTAYRLALKARDGADRGRQGAGRGCAGARAAGVAVDRAGAAVAASTVRPGRQPAAAHGHEDVVMLRRSFRAMGTDVELLLDAEPGRARGTARSTGPRRSSSGSSR